MGKKRNADKKSLARAGGCATSSTNDGGGRSNNSKFSAFEFNDEDKRVEEESRKAVAKFGAKSPNRKPLQSRKSVDKYEFLASCADANDRVSQHRTFGRDVALSFGPLNCEPEPILSLESQSSECTCQAKSSVGMRRTRCHTTGKNHEAMVAVSPYYVKYKNKYYTSCLLTFSPRWIRLDDCDKKNPFVEWSTSDILNIEHQRCESANSEVINLCLRCQGDIADEADNSNLCFHGIIQFISADTGCILF